MFLFLLSTKSVQIDRNKVIESFYKKLKVYNKKVIDFVWENMMTEFFGALLIFFFILSTTGMNTQGILKKIIDVVIWQ